MIPAAVEYHERLMLEPCNPHIPDARFLIKVLSNHPFRFGLDSCSLLTRSYCLMLSAGPTKQCVRVTPYNDGCGRALGCRVPWTSVGIHCSVVAVAFDSLVEPSLIVLARMLVASILVWTPRARAENSFPWLDVVSVLSAYEQIRLRT